jgi:hypothetical protein
MENPEKLATWGTTHEEKQNKNTTQYVLDATIRKQSQTTQIKHEPSYKEHHFYAEIVRQVTMRCI